MPVDAMIDVARRPDPDRRARRSRHSRLRRAVVHRRHRQVEQRRRHQDRLQGRHRSAERATCERFGFGRAVSPDFPGESPGIVWDRDQVDRQRAGVGVDGLSGRRDAAADGGRRQRGRQRRRVHRAARRPRRVSRRAAATGAAEGRASRRSSSRDGRDADDDHGAGRRARHGEGARRSPGYTVAGKTGTANKLVNGRYSNRHLRVVCRLRAVARSGASTILVVLDSPHGRTATSAAPVSAPIFRRIAEAALRYLGVPPSINPAPPVLVARQTASVAASTASRPRSAAIVVTDRRTIGRHRARRRAA